LAVAFIVVVVGGAVKRVCAVGEVASTVVFGGGDACEGIDDDLLVLAVEVAVLGNLTVCVCGFENPVYGIVC
jgi:hypothetical protein